MNLHTIAGSRDTNEFKAFGQGVEAKCKGLTAFNAAMGNDQVAQKQTFKGPAAA